MRVTLLVGLALISACTTSGGASETTDPPPSIESTTTTVPEAPRQIEATLSVGSEGSTEPLTFMVPPGTRSVAVTAVGAASSVIGVSELTLADGVDRVGISRIPPPLLENIATQHVRLLPGDVFQEAGVGVHAFVYPNEPVDGALPAGEATLGLVSTGRSVDVTVSLSPVSEDLVLPLDVFVIDDDLTLDSGSAALDRASELLGQAGITIRWETVSALEADEPQIGIDGVVAVDGPVADLVGAASAMGSDALDVFVLSRLPVSGLSPRIPGPATPSPLRAVLVKSTQRPSDLGRVIAHEVAHYLGLHHLELYTDENRAISDPIPDTSPGGNNLMSGGTILTEGQIDVLRRSPLLEPTG